MNIKNISVIGCGVIGASWAAYFLARGFHVTAHDPADHAETRLRELVAAYWAALEAQGLHPDADLARLTFEQDLAAAVENADFIQENAPERLSVKHALLAGIEASARPDVIIASSSS